MGVAAIYANAAQCPEGLSSTELRKRYRLVSQSRKNRHDFAIDRGICQRCDGVYGEEPSSPKASALDSRQVGSCTCSRDSEQQRQDNGRASARSLSEEHLRSDRLAICPDCYRAPCAMGPRCSSLATGQSLSKQRACALQILDLTAGKIAAGILLTRINFRCRRAPSGWHDAWVTYRRGEGDR